jgi:uncharacterized membrane protein
VSLAFSNSTSETVYVVIAYNNSDCGSGGDAWMKEGWWPIQPGGNVTVHGGLSNGATYFYYAHTTSGREWGGDFGTSVPNEAFQQCWNIGTSTSREVSMREFTVPVTSVSHTINLIV